MHYNIKNNKIDSYLLALEHEVLPPKLNKKRCTKRSTIDLVKMEIGNLSYIVNTNSIKNFIYVS